MAAFQEFLDLILPTRCVLCRRFGGVICSSCSTGFAGQVRPAFRDGFTGRLSGFSASDYDEPSRLILHAFKEKGLTALSGFIGQKLAPLLENYADESDLCLVPVPSSKENYIKRGYKPALILAKAARRASGLPQQVFDSLKFARVVADQSKLQSAQRTINLAGSMVADQKVRGKRVLLVDDIVTTGTTLVESARAVSAAGGEVVGFITFSETLLKTPAKK